MVSGLSGKRTEDGSQKAEDRLKVVRVSGFGNLVRD
jgi:hypothetical protein